MTNIHSRHYDSEKSTAKRPRISLVAALKTFAKAWAFGYILTGAPALLSLLIQIVRRPIPFTKAFRTIVNLLRSQATHNGYPWLFGGVFGGSKLVEHLLHQIILYRYKRLTSGGHYPQNAQSQTVPPSSAQLTFLATLLASTTTLFATHTYFPQTQTLDLTFFAFVRALDVFAHIGYESKRVRNVVPGLVLEHGDVIVFVIACTEIMFAWFYEPERLPRTYTTWISRMSSMDPALLTALRLIREGVFKYNQPFPEGLLPSDWYPFILSGRIPCSIVHGGVEDGCEVNAIRRFIQGFADSLKIYLPVHLLPNILFRTMKFRSHPVETLWHIFLAACRSSAFLATYITILWYSVCITRTRIGPSLKLPQQTLDNIYGPLLGSCLCGLSLLIENKHRRGEMALYVAPRALFSMWERFGTKVGFELNANLKEAGELGVFGVAVAVVVWAMRVNETKWVRPSIRGALGWLAK